MLGGTGNKWAVRILLEYVLVNRMQETSLVECKHFVRILYTSCAIDDFVSFDKVYRKHIINGYSSIRVFPFLELMNLSNFIHKFVEKLPVHTNDWKGGKITNTYL